ncbi:hypothetical protein SAMN05216532_4362 [Streptomyces sp. 2231.1]|uniref:DUF5819 family protein n=1 Tax=Streptomyces sp. 2231.1 TaxID=1855347 RepID=UPI00089C246A|nr:DUF5819 family protein [Streptomyces sp. 2231.1]SED37595.1 hypothetical protein SAMN05216532_4362 [Streptomyces sp. 2231.1]
MDVNDEDSGARRGTGAFEPSKPPEQPRPPEHSRPSEKPRLPEPPLLPRQPGASEQSRPGERPYAPERAGSSGAHVLPEPGATDGPDEADASDEASDGGGALAAPRVGVVALSPRYQVGAAVALAVVAVAACVHLLMVFLSLAPANTVTKQHGKAVEDWVYPEFEQNWKLFAPNPLQQNVGVQVRAELRTNDGGVRTTGWTDLSAQDGAAIKGNPVPSHTQQNELRRAWDFFVATHTGDNRPVALRGALSEQYLRRIVVMRLYRDTPAAEGGVIQRVQVRSATTNVQPPEWSRERVSDKPVYRQLPWWSVTADEAAGGVR